MTAGHCALPDTDWGKNAWWMVDLGDIYNFSSIIIYNRDSEGKYVNKFDCGQWYVSNNESIYGTDFAEEMYCLCGVVM